MTRGPVATNSVTAIACGLFAGACWVFSVMIMPALDELPPPQGIAAMQEINRAADAPLFGLVLAVSAAGCVALVAWAAAHRHSAVAVPAALGAATYLVGAMLVTVAGNVPLNDDLDGAGPRDTALWDDFLTDWTAWNGVRVVATLVATVLLVLALTRARRRA